MSAIASPQQKRAAGKFKNVMATYNDAEDLINIGAYRKGANKNIDNAIEKIDAVNDFLLQSTDEKFSFEEIIDQLETLFPDEPKK
jgi:flagellum-specific ATP synthase